MANGGQQYSVKELATLYRKQIETELPDSLESVNQKTDEEIVFGIMKLEKDNPILRQAEPVEEQTLRDQNKPASTQAEIIQPVVNTEVTKQDTNKIEKITDDASTDINPADGSNIESPSHTGGDAPIQFDYHNYLDSNNPVEAALMEELDATHTKTIVKQDNQTIDLKTKKVYETQEDGSLQKTHIMSDVDLGEVQAKISTGAITPESNIEFEGMVSDSQDVEDTRENFESEENRKRLVEENEEIVQTKVDSLIADGDNKMPVTLSKSAAKQFESAYDELGSLGIELSIADSKRGAESQMQAHQEWLDSGKKGPVKAHPDVSFHTIGYAIDLAQTNPMLDNIDQISEVMRRHGWRQHPDEWWHFSINQPPDIKISTEKSEEIDEAIDLTKELDESETVLQLSVLPPVIASFQSAESNFRIIKEHGKDAIIDRIIPRFMAYTHNWTNQDYTDYSKAQTWVMNGIPEEDLEAARNSIIIDAIAEWDDEDEKVALQKYGRLHFGVAMAGAKRGLGNMAWDRVFANAVDNSLTGIMHAGAKGHNAFLVSGIDQQLVAMGILPELNTQERAVSSALTLMMAADALTFLFGGKGASWSYKQVIKKGALMRTRASLISMGVRLGNGPGYVNLNKIASYLLKPGLGNAVAGSSVAFGAYDAGLEGFRLLTIDASHPDNMIYAKDRNGDVMLDNTGKPIKVINTEHPAWAIFKAGLDGMMTGTLLAVGGVGIGTPISQKVQKAFGATKLYKASSAMNPNFIFWLSQKTGNLTGTMLSEYPLFTGKSYIEAIHSARESAHTELNLLGISKPTDAQIDEKVDFRKIRRDIAVNTAGFIFVLKQLHALAPTISREIQTRRQNKAVVQNWVIKVEEALHKNPETDIGELIVKISLDEGVPLQAIDINATVAAHFITQPSTPQGKLILNEALKTRFPEHRVRDLAFRLKLDQKKSYEELLQEIFVLENQHLYEQIEKSVDREETMAVAHRENLTEQQVEEIEFKAQSIITDTDKENIGKAGEQLVLNLIDAGFTATEINTKIAKMVAKKIKELDNQEDLFDISTVKKPVKKTRKDKKKAKKGKKKSAAQIEKDKLIRIARDAQKTLLEQTNLANALLDKSTIEPTKVFTSKDIIIANKDWSIHPTEEQGSAGEKSVQLKENQYKIVKYIDEATGKPGKMWTVFQRKTEADDWTAEAGGLTYKNAINKVKEIEANALNGQPVSETFQIESPTTTLKKVKGFADLKKPYGAKDITKRLLFDNMAEMEAWKDNLTASAPHMALSILYKPVTAGKDKGKVHAQAFEKEITKKVLRTGQVGTIKIAEKQRYKEDKRIQELRYRKKNWDMRPDQILRDPSRNPLEKLERYINLHEQVELLEGYKEIDQISGAVIKRTGQQAIIEAHRLAQEKDKARLLKVPSAETKLLENGIKEYDRVIELTWREINYMSNDKTLSKQIADKVKYLSKSAGGFIDLSKDKGSRFSKEQIDRLNDDLKRDLKEYAVRYFDKSQKGIDKMSVNDMANVMSEEFGLPKATIRKWAVKPENWGKIREAVVEYQGTRIKQAIDAKRLEHPELIHDYLEDHIQLSQIGGVKGVGVITDTYKDPIVARALFIGLNKMQANPSSLDITKEGVLKFSKIIESIDTNIRDNYIDFYNKIANREKPESGVFDIVSHLPHLYVYAKWSRDKAWIELTDAKTKEDARQKFTEFQIHDTAQKFILKQTARTLKAASEAHNIIEDGLVIKKLWQKAGIAYTPETAEMIVKDMIHLMNLPLETMWNTSWIEKSMGVLAELNRNMLLASFSAGSKAVVGNTLSWAMNRVAEGPRNAAFKIQKNVHYDKLAKIDQSYEDNKEKMKKSEAKKIWEVARDEEFARYNNKAVLGWEWYQQEGYRTAFQETFQRQVQEMTAIMMESPTIYDANGNVIKAGWDKLNPNVEREYGKSLSIPGKLGTILRAPQNLMGALDNMVRMPMLMGEFERLIWHQATYEWRDLYGNKTKLPDPSNAKTIGQMDAIVARLREDVNSQTYRDIWTSANTYASKIVFQDRLYWEFMKKLNNIRIATGEKSLTRAGGHAMNILMPFVLTGINAVKMGYEYSPTSLLPGPGFLSFWGDVDYATSGSKLRNKLRKPEDYGKSILNLESSSHLYRRFGNIIGGRNLAEKEIYTLLSKKLMGGALTASMAYSFLKFTDEEDSKFELQRDIWANIGTTDAIAPEARTLMQAYGLQSYGLPIPEGNFLAPGGGSMTARGFDPAWAMITQYPQIQNALTVLKETLKGNNENPELYGMTGLMNVYLDYYEQVQDTMEESPFLILFDRIADLATTRHGDEVLQVFLAKVASNFLSPTSLGTFNRMREQVKYKKYSIDEYTEDGISYGELFDFIPDKDNSNILRKAFLGDVPSLLIGKIYEEGDMYLWEDVAQLVGGGVWDEETESFIDTQGDAMKLREKIVFPYTTVPLYRLNRHTPKYPVLSIFGDTIPMESPANLFGIKIIESILDPKSKLLTEEYMWLLDNKARAKDVFANSSQSLTVALLEGSDEERGIRKEGGTDFRGTLKFDREQEWAREKMIGDLFKEKLHQIVGERKGPLGNAYSALKSKISKIDEKMSKVKDTQSDEYRQLDMARREAVLQVSNMWNRTATSIRHLVDFTIFGEERHNMKFWAEYMQAYEMDAEGLRLEIESLYPAKTPDEIGDILEAWNAAINQGSEPNRMKNIVFNEIYRAFRKKHGIDTRHHLDPENLSNLAKGFVGRKIPKGWKGIDIDTRNIIDDIFDEDNTSKQKTKKYFQPAGFKQDMKGGYITRKGEKIKKKRIKVPKPPEGKYKPKGGRKGKREIEILDNFQIKDKDFLFSRTDVKKKISEEEDALPKYPVISKLSKWK